ncbi:MAG: DivIVA domain-containing protein [Chitinispirillaceae bacterium]|nr:DivIVA domain-containing protein [Chitinispirillaceae bacterium]
MRITPLDIRKQPFRRTLRGFDPDAVNSFLEMVATEFEGIIRQNSEFATRIKQLEEKVEGYAKIERTLNETLLTAQKITDEARVNAQKEAELIIKDATIRAGVQENEIRQRVMQLENDLASLKNHRDTFLARFRGMLTTQLNLLSVIGGDLQVPVDDKDIEPVAELSDESESETDISDAPRGAHTPLGAQRDG